MPHKAIADAAHGNDHIAPSTFGDLVAELRDMYIERSCFSHIALAPNLSEQLLALDRNTCTCDQHFEKLEFLQGKPQVVTFVKDLIYVIVNDKALLSRHVKVCAANIGLDMGDQLKPFSVLELIARVKTNIRRANLYVTNPKGFVIDNNVYKVFYEGHDLGLTLKEYKLLKMLITRAGTTISREELFREVWGESYMGETRTLDIHISQLRDKITECGGGDVIVTVRGIGYRFDAK